ncbi:glutathione synthetase isoform X1 [Folsomia candida]|uniref:glutathione synthetase isoform X1 n=1 Tax=Folsomia candida TaxID=158441 RepID=UPI000B8FFE96|nr:glutathione synthetase isoform X1 [Folsomia candida]
MEPCIPLPLADGNTLKELIQKAKDWAIMHGAGMRSKDSFSPDSINFAPFMLLPSTFPRCEFERAVGIQPVLNELMHKVAHDYDFLKNSLETTIKVDEFTGRLFNIYETVRAEGITQPFSLGLLRSDLMLETDWRKCHSEDPATSAPYCCWKQVEVNTIAAGFGFLGPISGQLHRFVLTELGHLTELRNLPDNNALEGLCGGMLSAWKVYNQPMSAILFVIEDVTYNICDQRFHEFEIQRQNAKVRVIRNTLTEIATIGKLDNEKRLFLNDTEIAVVYFRAGYTPDHYYSETEWNARLLIERSLAIKCPSIQYHLTGTKKVQQELARPGMLDKYLTPDKVESVKEIFTGLYSLGKDEVGDKAMQMALENPTRFVLKPQREGGGNNMYGENVKSYLEKIKDSDERSAWILMERINPPVQTNYMIRPNIQGPIVTEVVSELGIFGVVLGNADTILENTQVGHMLRTKISSADEGGVAAGFGALDSVYLVDIGKAPKKHV